MTWKKVITPLLGKAIYCFNKDGTHYLNLKLGDTVIITEVEKDWYHGYSLLDSKKDVHGIFPKTYVRILSTTIASKRLSMGECSVDSLREEMLDELLSSLHEWFPTWRDLHLNREPLATTVHTVMREFISLYQEIQLVPLTRAQLLARQARVVNKVDFVNHADKLSFLLAPSVRLSSSLQHDLVPRVDGRPVNLDEVTFVELYEIHEQSATKTRTSSVSHFPAMVLRFVQKYNEISRL